MAQPPAYNPTTDFSDEETDGVVGRSTVRTAMLDAELANLATSINAIRANLALIQRDDTGLKDLVVSLASLSGSVRAIITSAGTTPRGDWVTATSYAVKDIVVSGTGTYMCVTAHTSGVFATDLAASKWMKIYDSDIDAATGVPFTPAAGIAATNVQAALEELSAEALKVANNLSDLASAATARSNLGVAIANKGGLLAGQGSNVIGEQAAGSDGAALIADASQTRGLVWVPQMPRSFAPNPFFQVDQLVNSASARADDAYGHDHWYVLTQTGTVAVSTQTLQEDGQPANARLTQSQAVSQRMGYACIIEADVAQALRGKQVTFRPRVRISSSQAVRIAVVEWTGTADSVTSDIVNDWTSSDYSDGAARFFVDASQAPLGNGAKTPSAATWTDMDALTVTVGSSCNNLILFVWTEQVAAQNVTLDIGKVRLTLGSYAGEIYIPTFQEVLEYAQRFFWKSFRYNIAPAQNAGAATGEIRFPALQAGATAQRSQNILLPMMRSAGPPSAVTYNPEAANAQVRDITAGADCSVTAATPIGRQAVNITCTGNASTAIANALGVHLTVDSRL